jgi:hypothetical protein
METQEHEKGKKNLNIGYKQMSDRTLNNEQRIAMIVGFIIILISAALELEGLSLVIQKLIKCESDQEYQHHTMTTKISVFKVSRQIWWLNWFQWIWWTEWS